MTGTGVRRAASAVAGFVVLACSAGGGDAPPEEPGDSGTGSGGATSTGGAGQGGIAPGAGGRGADTGGAGTGGVAAPTSSPRAACRYYLTRACERRMECSGDPLDFDLCIDVADACPEYFFSPGSTRTVASLVSCAEQWATLDCGIVNASGAPACASDGTRTVNEACLFASQCEGQRCDGSDWRADGPQCGLCAPVSGLGGPCTSTAECAIGLHCLGGACAEPEPAPPPPGPGEPCTDACLAGHFCSGTPRVCTALPGLGQPCSSLRCAAEVRCDRLATPPTCVARTAPGGPCTPVGAECVAGAVCRTVSGTNRCVAPREEDEPCAGPNDSCSPGLQCTGGRCVDAARDLFADACGP